MEHIAILSPGPLSRILSGDKTMESRWYKTQRAPWNKIVIGEMVWLKKSGGAVVGRATVSEVMQFSDLTKKVFEEICKKYGKAIWETTPPYSTVKDKKYCILMRLEEVNAVVPFMIDKTGFGNATAWMIVESISDVSLRSANPQ